MLLNSTIACISKIRESFMWHHNGDICIDVYPNKNKFYQMGGWRFPALRPTINRKCSATYLQIKFNFRGTLLKVVLCILTSFWVLAHPKAVFKNLKKESSIFAYFSSICIKIAQKQGQKIRMGFKSLKDCLQQSNIQIKNQKK